MDNMPLAAWRLWKSLSRKRHSDYRLMDKLVRVGIIGLGRHWRRRYLPALLALRDRFQVRSVCDQMPQRSAEKARRLGCKPAGGPTEMLERDDIDALLLIDRQWYGLWPLEPAARAGKPVFCRPSLELDPHADALHKRVQEAQLPVMVELAPRLAPATMRLRQLLEGTLGSAQSVYCRFGQCYRERRRPAPAYHRAPSILGAEGIALLDWCTTILGSEPASAHLTGEDTATFANLLLDWPDGRTAQITRWRTRAGTALPRSATGDWRSPRLQVLAARGTVTVELPNRVSWADAEGQHRLILPATRPLAELQLEAFHTALMTGQPPRPSLSDAHRVLSWLRAAATGRERRKACLLGEPPAPDAPP
jgi:predicted dehydrogenase